MRLTFYGSLNAARVTYAADPTSETSAPEPAQTPAVSPASNPESIPAAVPLPSNAPRITPGPVEPLQVRTSRGPVTFQVELADTDEERARGLMFRGSMPADRGMIFVFDQAAPQAFWMQNTYIPLDIIYIGADGRIVSIAKNTPTLSETPIPSGAPARYVLEINAGLSDRHGIAPGDRVTHRLLP